MGRYAAQVTLLSATGSSEDNQSNTFAVGQIPTLDASFANSWTTAIKDFYDDVVTTGGLKGMSQNNHLIKFYDIQAPAPNYPLFERNFNLDSAPFAVDMPQEVALVISYSNVSATTVARGRRRGRIYISGWGESTNVAGQPTDGTCDSLLTNFTDYVVAVNAISTFDASIWSRTGETTYVIEEAHVDNAWDTQRRRGTKSDYRATWTLP